MTKIDFTKPVQTKDGRPVRIICTDRKFGSYVVVGLIERDGREDLYSWDINGGYYGFYNNNFDLVNVPEKKTVYQYTVYNKKSKNFYTVTNKSKKEAEASLFLHKNYYKVITGIQEVTFEVPND